MSKKEHCLEPFVDGGDGKAWCKLCRANTGCRGGSANWRVFKLNGYLGNRFNNCRVPGFSNTRKSEH